MISDGKGGSDYEKFYEAFPVAQGQRSPARPKGSVSDDAFLYVGSYSGNGDHAVFGIAKFYEGPLPADFKKDHPGVVMGMGQISSPKKPPFWDGSGARHVVQIQFDCRNAPTVTTIPDAKVVPWSGP